MKKIIAGFATVLLASGFAAAAGIAPASAQAPSISGSAACQVDGTYTVTWSYAVANAPEGLTATASATASSPAGTVTGGGAALTSSTFTQSGIAGTAATASVTIQTAWSDGVTESTPASVALTAGCAAPAPVVDPAPVAAPVAEPAPEVVVETPAVEAPVAAPPVETAPVSTAPVGAVDPAVSTDALKATAAGEEPASCLTDDSVSYSYDNTTNSGTLNVGTTNESRGTSAEVLCEPLYVAATSWNFLADDSLWPVQLNHVEALEEITAAGSYDFGTPVQCGKGIIYASHSEIEIPFEVLEGYETAQETWLQDLFPGYEPSFMYNEDDCVAPVTGEVAASPQTCDIDDPLSMLSGQIEFLLDDNVTYAVDGVEVTDEVIDVEPGTYTVTATAAEGYTLVGDSEWELTVDAAACDLPVFAVWDANASAVSQQCPPSSGTPISGYIEVEFPEGAESAVQYFIGDTELTSSRTEVEPGTYTVTAVPRVAEDAILGDTSWTLTVGSAACALVPTLATTGTDASTGLGLGAGLLMLGGTLTLMRRGRSRTRTRAED